MDTPSALAFSRSMSSLNCGASSTPLGRTPASARILARPRPATGCARPGRPARPSAAAVLQHHVEAGGVAEFEHRRRRHRDDVGFLDGAEILVGAANNGLHGLRALLALVPVAQLDEQQAGVLARAGEVEAVHGEHALDRVLLLVRSGTAAPCRAPPGCAPSRRPAASAPGRT